MRPFSIYVGGEFKKTDESYQVYNPYDKSILTETYLANNTILEQCIVKAIEAEKEYQEVPVYARYEILMSIAEGLKIEKDNLAVILSNESAKPIKIAKTEINRSIQTFLIAAEECKRLPSEYIPIDWTADGKGKEAILKYFPIGVVFGISPFNFPMNLVAHKIAPAIAAGCPIILKPSSKTPLSALELARIIDSTSLPKGMLSVVPMEHKTISKIYTDERIKLITFTGSSDVGRKIQDVAPRKKVVLELGGNAAAIISKNCNDIDNAVKRCIMGSFTFSGQVCIHTQRIYVDKRIVKEFTDKFLSNIQLLKNGEPLSLKTDISVLINIEAAKKVESWLHEAIAKGAKILVGGKRNGSYIEPTVITKTRHDMKISSEEVFGPVVLIEQYSEFEEAIEEVNNSKYGLQAGVFTNHISEMNYAYKKLNVGTVIINDVPTFRVDHMPYGGVKESGVGKEGVKYAMMEMLEPKLLIKNYN